MALTELKGQPTGTQTVVNERGPVRVFAEALMDDDDTYKGDHAPGVVALVPGKVKAGTTPAQIGSA